MERLMGSIIAIRVVARQFQWRRMFCIIIAGVLALSVISCVKQRPQQVTIVNYALKPFKTLMVEGNARVELVNGPYGIEITGTKEGNYKNIERVAQKTISVREGKGIRAIKVMAPELRKIIVRNNGSLFSENFLSNSLTVGAYDNGKITLKGRFAVDKIFQRGHGMLNIGWIDSDKVVLDIHGNGPVYLSGSAKKLIARLFNDSHVNARYLRAQKAAVFTVDRSQMDVMALRSLEALAINNSNIYYYKRPKNISVVTRDSGSVLQPDWIE